MKILVTGATGFVGTEVVRHLAGDGHQLKLLVRNPKDRGAVSLAADSKGELVAGDVADAQSLREVCCGVDAIIHLVGIISECGKINFERIHTGGTRNLVDAALKQGVGRFLHMSALGTRPNAISRYHQTKWAAEEAVRNSHLAWTIFRPSLIYGPEDHFTNLFARIIRISPVIPVIGNGQARLGPVAVEVVAAAFARALNTKSSISGAFDLVGPDTLSFDEILLTIERVLGRRRLHLHLPLPVACLQASLLKLLFCSLLHRPPPLNRDQILMLQEDNTGDFGAATRLLGLDQPGFEQGLRRYLVP